MISIVGYLLHRHKFKTLAKAIILCDEDKSDNAEGGTGKSILVQALSYLVKVVTEDGKHFITSSFAYSQLDHDTAIFHIDDAAQKFDFEKIFPAITGDLIVERKYQNKFVIPYEETPKILITTNYVIVGRGNSFDRRKIEVEFSPHYNRFWTPNMEFESDIFDWDKTQWNCFDNFIPNFIRYFFCHFRIYVAWRNAICQYTVLCTFKSKSFCQGYYSPF